MKNQNPTPQTYIALQQAYDLFNQRLFDGKLDNSLITLQRRANTFGYMSYNRFIAIDDKNSYTHELALNPEFFGIKPLIEVFQTLTHEMAHLWQYQFGNPSQKTYHNKEWAEKMESIGLMPSDTGRIGGKKIGQQMADYPIPNGLFLSVCNELIEQKVIVSWYDRFKPKKSSNERMLNDRNFAETLMSHAQESLLTVPHLTNETALSPNYIIDQNSNDAIETVELIPLKPKPKTSKHKFTCICGENLWGKPTLNAMCKKCKTDFVLVQE
ncbi:SprT-like domain-containing protein [Acinetobacter sp. ULE_I064]|uniref:SprT-like domain-containing protein n=1 Tax=Acinetobacter sp. ULE_I064 TaxID=3373071 RepID=UPI003AF5DC61